MLLIIDSSTEKSQVILAKDKENFDVKRLPPGLKSSHLLVSEIQRFGVIPDQIVVTTGVGSYTGIRLGLAVAKGLSLPKALPIRQIHSLYGFIPPKEGRFLSLIDARGGGVDILLQQRIAERIEVLSEPQRISLEELPSRLISCEGVVGPCLKRFDMFTTYESYADAKRLVILGISCYTHADLY